MYDWDEITGNSSNSIGYVNFVDEKHEFVSTHYIVNGIPVVKVSLSKSADDTLEWLYEYLYTKLCIVPKKIILFILIILIFLKDYQSILSSLET